MNPTEKAATKEFQDKKQRKDQKEKKYMIALCATEKHNLWNIESGC